MNAGKNTQSLQEANFIQDSLRAMEMLAAHGWLPPVKAQKPKAIIPAPDTLKVDTLQVAIKDTATSIPVSIATPDSVPKPRKPRKPKPVAKDSIAPPKPKLPELQPIALPPLKEPMVIPIKRDSV